MNKITRFKDIPRFISHGSYACDYPMDRLVKWVEEAQEEEHLELCPEFQRGHVWTKEQQMAYIEFLLRGGKTGRDLYFNNPSQHHTVPEGAYNAFVCVDGLQRITAMRRFIHNEIPAFESFFSEYTDNMRIIKDTIRIHINDLQTEKEVIMWYLEMNSGGTPHSREELERVKALLNSL